MAWNELATQRHPRTSWSPCSHMAYAGWQANYIGTLPSVLRTPEDSDQLSPHMTETQTMFANNSAQQNLSWRELDEMARKAVHARLDVGATHLPRVRSTAKPPAMGAYNHIYKFSQTSSSYAPPAPATGPPLPNQNWPASSPMNRNADHRRDIRPNMPF